MGKNLSLTNAMSNKYEPKRQNRWVISILPPTAAGETFAGGAEELAFAAHTANRPDITFDQTEMHRQNERFYVAGKPTWGEITMEFYDFVNGENSASRVLWNWATAIYNPVTGSMGYKADYSTTATLSLLDPIGDVAETWSLFYIWPTSVNWNELSSESSEIVNVSVTFRYDYALMGVSADLASEKYNGSATEAAEE